jgi:hypothetical protein
MVVVFEDDNSDQGEIETRASEIVKWVGLPVAG